jgi:hypothetical protein
MIGLCGHENYGTHMSRHTSLLRKHRESQDLARRHIVQPRNLRFPSAGDVHRTAKLKMLFVVEKSIGGSGIFDSCVPILFGKLCRGLIRGSQGGRTT